MKIIIALLAIATFVAAEPVSEIVSEGYSELIDEPIAPLSISSIVEDVIIGIRDQLPCGFPDLGIPPLAPLKIGHEAVNIDTSFFKMHGAIDQFRLNGMNDFEIEEMKVNAITSKVNFRLRFRNINIDTIYDLNILLQQFGFTINQVGKGHAKFAVRDVVITGLLKYNLGIISGKVKLKALDIHTHIGEVESDIEGLFGEGIVNHKLNDYIEEAVELIVNENENLIAQTIESVALPMVNDVLDTFTLADLAGSIISGGDGDKEACIPPELD